MKERMKEGRSRHTFAVLLQMLYEWIHAEQCAKSPFNSVSKSPLPSTKRSLQTHAEVFISEFCPVRIISCALNSNMDINETAYSHRI